MISGNAFKPDDVITSMSGKTIEVLNTDAEGRLVLADAVTYAKHHGANYLVDVATLNRWVSSLHLGLKQQEQSQIMKNGLNRCLEASFEASEPIWRLPLFERDREESNETAKWLI